MTRMDTHMPRELDSVPRTWADALMIECLRKMMEVDQTMIAHEREQMIVKREITLTEPSLLVQRTKK
ncbi:hypothetical protein BGZ80_005222 [Entomortierella chlamydospora]|uniref:Uncharacterized protein n=1 Tax=Entomortierella chlamydospora TaxID=101097 RepID=A0A9P6MKJ1_9FUNG|nr:hypothetical protein BGZ80_005222 [Entomortierella chlamydospora]